MVALSFLDNPCKHNLFTGIQCFKNVKFNEISYSNLTLPVLTRPTNRFMQLMLRPNLCRCGNSSRMHLPG